MTPLEAGEQLEKLLEEYRKVDVRESWDIIYASPAERDTDAVPKTKAFVAMTRFAHQNAEVLRQAGRIPFPPEEKIVRESWWFQHCVEHHPELTKE